MPAGLGAVIGPGPGGLIMGGGPVGPPIGGLIIGGGPGGKGPYGANCPGGPGGLIWGGGMLGPGRVPWTNGPPLVGGIIPLNGATIPQA